jgi:hypothetical protein
MPPSDDELSVFRVADLSEEAIWQLADEHVVPLRRLPVLGRAELKASEVFGASLRIKCDDTPPRHAAIIGWPKDDDPDAQHAQRKSICQGLAAAAAFTAREPVVPVPQL